MNSIGEATGVPAERLNRRCRVEELSCRTTAETTEPDGTLDEALALLTGLPAGERGECGKYPAGSVNALAEARVRKLARRRQELAREALLRSAAAAPSA